jgi:hypothetical protein
MIELVINATPAECYLAFCDLQSARLWVPGLKKLRIVRSDAKGRPLEVIYEYGDSLSYALVYAYDDRKRQVRWVPSAGVQDGVSGWAAFDAAEEGCRFRYSLESVRGRAQQHPSEVAHAFVNWVSKPAP